MNRPIKRVVLLVEHEDGKTYVTQIAGARSLTVTRRWPRLRRLARLRITLVDPGATTTFDPALVIAPLPASATDWASHIAALEQFDRRNQAA